MLNTKNFKGKYEAKVEFSEGCRGSNQKTLRVCVCVGGGGGSEYVYFLEQHNSLLSHLWLSCCTLGGNKNLNCCHSFESCSAILFSDAVYFSGFCQ